MNTSKLSFIIILMMSFFVTSVIAQEGLPEQVTIEFEDLFPEGIEWDAEREQFLVGSWTQQTVFAVADDGTLTPLLEDDDLHLINGIHIDNVQGRLLVSNTDTPAPIDCIAIREDMPFTSVGIFDLATGERLQMVDLTDLVPERGSLINDLTSDTDGNIYATDWCGSAIYKIDIDGNASILLEDDSYYNETEIGAGAFNGIDWHPDNYLIVSGGFGNPLYKVTLDETPVITPVELEVPAFADGITMLPDGDIVVAGALFHEEGFDSTTMQFSSDDDWQSAALVNNVVYNRFATTAAIRDGAVYSVISGVVEASPVSTFEIIRIDFEDDTEADDAVEVDPNTIFALLEASPVYSTLTEGIIIAGYEDVLRSEGEYMVFALTNAGFRGAASQLGTTVEELFADEDMLTEIIGMHIFEERVTTADILRGVTLTTLTGETLRTVMNDDSGYPTGFAQDSFGRMTSLISPTLSPNNGAIYGTRGLILPPSFEYTESN